MDDLDRIAARLRAQLLPAIDAPPSGAHAVRHAAARQRARDPMATPQPAGAWADIDDDDPAVDTPRPCATRAERLASAQPGDRPCMPCSPSTPRTSTSRPGAA